MGNGAIGKVIYFWIFMIGVILMGKLMGVMEDSKTTIIICIAAALLFIAWNVAKSLGRKKREEKAWQAEQARRNSKRKRK